MPATTKRYGNTLPVDRPTRASAARNSIISEERRKKKQEEEKSQLNRKTGSGKRPSLRSPQCAVALREKTLNTGIQMGIGISKSTPKRDKHNRHDHTDAFWQERIPKENTTGQCDERSNQDYHNTVSAPSHSDKAFQQSLTAQSVEITKHELNKDDVFDREKKQDNSENNSDGKYQFEKTTNKHSLQDFEHEANMVAKECTQSKMSFKNAEAGKSNSESSSEASTCEVKTQSNLQKENVFIAGKSAKQTERQVKSATPKPSMVRAGKEPSANLRFYQNKISSKPSPGYKIDEMLKWKGNYDRLERNHSYIQWLFPIKEGRGVNREAQPLYQHEAEAIKENSATHKRVLEAYKMMLNFYGMELVNDIDGRIQRCKNWTTRYSHLNKSKHNYLRITRIIKSIGELGYERFQAPWVDFMMSEVFRENKLENLRHNSCLSYWLLAVKEEGDKEYLYAKYGRFLYGCTDHVDHVDDSESEGEDLDGEVRTDLTEEPPLDKELKFV